MTCPCGKPISTRNRSGYCRSCVARIKHQDPVWHAQWLAATRAGANDPELRQRRSEWATRRYTDPVEREKASQAKLEAYASDPAMRERVASAGTETLRKWMAGPGRHYDWSAKRRERGDNRLAWCPAHRREEYRRMTKSLHMTAAEAREVIENDERAIVRRRMAR